MANATTDHEEIRRWAESKGGKPAAVDRTHEGEDVGIIRIMFPENPQSQHKALVEISWDEFFEQFEESQLALLYDENSLFSKIVGRDTLEHREHGEHTSRRQMRDEGGGGSGQHSQGGSRQGDGGKAQAEASGRGERSQSGGKGHVGQDSGRQQASARNEEGKGKSEASGKGGGKESAGEGSDDLKSREYRDEKGNIRHHTHAYMEQHGKQKS